MTADWFTAPRGILLNLGKRSGKLLPVVLVAIFLWPMASSAANLTLGVLAFRTKPETMEQWQPLADYLSKAVPGKSVVLRALTYPELNAAIQGGEVDFVFTNPAHYIELRQRYGLSGALTTLTETYDGVPLNVFGGVIFALSSRADIQQLADLREKRVAFVNSSSLGGYQSQVLEMLHAGIEPPRVERSLVTKMPHSNVVAAVLSGEADAGFVRTGVIEHMAAAGKLDTSRIRILSPRRVEGFPFELSTPLYPEWPFIALSHVDGQVARRIAAALLAIEADTIVARATKIHGFSVPADYSPVENLMRELRVPPFDAPPDITLKDVWLQHRVVVLSSAMALTAILSLVGLLLIRNRQLLMARQEAEHYGRRQAESERQLKLAQAVARIGSWHFDIAADELNWSDETYRIFGLPPDMSLNFETFLAFAHPDDRDKVFRAWDNALNKGATYDIEHRILVDGQVRWVRERAEIVRTAGGSPLAGIGTVQEITEKKHAEAMIWHEANYDRLTDLPNRALLFDRLSVAMSSASRRKKRVALLFADLDGFKAVNDSYGHKAGDRVLTAVASRWRPQVRESDTVARLGGDEFAVLLVDLESAEAAERVAQKLIASLSEPIALPDGNNARVGCSIGISLFPDNAGEIDSMLAAADGAMYESKEKGKNCYTVSAHSPDMAGTVDDWIKIGDEHNLGIQAIDEQHRKLVELANRVNQAIHEHSCPEEVDSLMSELIELTRLHFESEEAWMGSQGYPNLAEHQREHGWLLNKLQYLAGTTVEGREILILQTIKDWLFHHIDTEDKKLAQFSGAAHR